MQRILMVFMLMVVIGICSEISVKAASLSIGETLVDEISSDGEEIYKLKVDSKRKIKITVTVNPIVVIDEYAYDMDYEEEYLGIYGKDYCYTDDDNGMNVSLMDSNVEDVFEKEVRAGKSLSKTVTLKKGKYEVWIFNGDCDLTYEIKVEDVSDYTTKIKLNKKKVELYTKQTYKLKASPKKKGKFIKKVTWKSSNKKIASVDKNGKITAKKAGKCTITAKVPGGKKVKCKVTVKKRPPIMITNVGFGLDYVGGIEPYMYIQNNTGKTIKYIYATVYFYNAVGDPAYCEITGKNYRKLRMIGPLKNEEKASYSYDAVAYNGTTSKIKIKTVKVEFMDGSTKTYTVNKTGR